MNLKQMHKLHDILTAVDSIADKDPQLQYFCDDKEELRFHLEITIKK